jgi:hypothetical protein
MVTETIIITQFVSLQVAGRFCWLHQDDTTYHASNETLPF